MLLKSPPSTSSTAVCTGQGESSGVTDISVTSAWTPLPQKGASRETAICKSQTHRTLTVTLGGSLCCHYPQQGHHPIPAELNHFQWTQRLKVGGYWCDTLGNTSAGTTCVSKHIPGGWSPLRHTMTRVSHNIKMTIFFSKSILLSTSKNVWFKKITVWISYLSCTYTYTKHSINVGLGLIQHFQQWLKYL